ncbi:MAG TPA: hypothetical protein VF575_05635 [Candidatus Saccharimonadales bacterium]|jgi:metal-responsive CopG/Arc/MetJ family transcriptional regulator
MKTAISIPDSLFQSAEQLASRLGKSRSELYANAITDYVARHYDKKVTEKLNTVYGQDDTIIDPVLSKLQAASQLKNNSW